jgi:hypothetical protein
LRKARFALGILILLIGGFYGELICSRGRAYTILGIAESVTSLVVGVFILPSRKKDA